MKIVFAGTPEFAATALAALVDAGHEVTLVLSQPDRPRGRGLRAEPGAVKAVALERGLPVFQPATLREPEAQQRIVAEHPDVMVVAAYGLLLPPAVLAIARHGALNIHASLLPRWRGAAPVQRAILAGDRQTGVCIMQMEAGLDTGPVLMREPVAIADDDSAGTLLEKLTRCGAALVLRALEGISAGGLVAEPQDGGLATYAAKLEKREARIDWREPALEVWRKVRAFNPVPGAAARLKGHDLKLWRAEPCAGSGAAGSVLATDGTGVIVACGEGAVRLTELQRAGGKRQPATEFARGMGLQQGDSFESVPSGTA